ncbi:hypothetical protein F4780DRAFT_783853 [Xylariomycetidae sp. FL0641]|nr:hypothetical protein F4780DRAFT_783853 [Xylariomycetidae sp. FL0641]
MADTKPAPRPDPAMPASQRTSVTVVEIPPTAHPGCPPHVHWAPSEVSVDESASSTTVDDIEPRPVRQRGAAHVKGAVLVFVVVAVIFVVVLILAVRDGK